jgi:hypothetical protein
MPSVEISEWKTLPSEGGTNLVVNERYLAVSSQARLCVWQDNSRILTLDARVPAPGWPQFIGQRIHWGPAIVDLLSGNTTWIEHALPAVIPIQSDRPHVYAWSPRGDWLLGSFSVAAGANARVELFQAATGRTLNLWEGSGLAPQSAWIGEQSAVVGFRNPMVFDYSGHQIAEIALNGAAVGFLDVTDDQSRLLILDVYRVLTWVDTKTWRILDRWPGPWLSAAVSSDARFVVALEFGGKLHFACLAGDRFQSFAQTTIDAGAISIAIFQNIIATVGRGVLQQAILRVDCPS